MAYGWGYAALRYFNASGAAADGAIGEDHDPETHLIPLVLEVALGQRPHITIFGDEFPTPDGTCIRDYIHVEDLATAHLAALERLEPGVGLKLNLGTGVGYSVKQVIDACRQVTGHPIPARGRGTGGRSAGPGGRCRPRSRETGLDPALHPARPDHRDGLGLASRTPRRLWRLSL